MNSEPALSVPGSTSKDLTLLRLRKRFLLGPSMTCGIRQWITMGHCDLRRLPKCNVFRVLLQSSWDKNACSRTVTRTDPMDDPFQTLTRIIGEWSDLELEEQHQSWRLFPVHRACTWSSANELSSPAYVLIRKENPFHFLPPHGVLEVVWGHRQWTTAIAFPKWINKYCLGLFAQVCGPMLTPCFAGWCDNTRLREELVEVSIGSFVQVHIRPTCSDLVRIDLQAALQRSIHTLHLPGAPLQDDLVQMKVFVPKGVSCFSGATFDCTSSFENWQMVLKKANEFALAGTRTL